MDDIVGARAFRLQEVSNPDLVGVRALDAWTLEVRLDQPTAYFLYLLGLPVSFPLPRETIETFGEEWWKPKNIVSNGAFNLLEFEWQENNQRYSSVLERNAAYFGEFRGNVGRAICATKDQKVESLKEWLMVRGQEFLTDKLDVVFGKPTDPTSGETITTDKTDILNTNFLVLNPSRAPLDNPRVRRALLLALDRAALQRTDPNGSSGRLATGGFIPPGMAGHSPEIGLKQDLETARQLLADAGFPGGKGFPVLQTLWGHGAAFLQGAPLLNELARQWREGLGIEINFYQGSLEFMPDVLFNGWVADYPDPDSFMRVSALSGFFGKGGWQEPMYLQLIQEALRTADRARRLALYRQADYSLVVEQALVYPLYHFRNSRAVKPWVKNARVSALGWLYLKNVVIEPR